MHQMCVTQIKNSTITPTFWSKKDRVSITEMGKNVGENLERKIGSCF